MLSILTAPNLSPHANLIHGFTTREVGDAISCVFALKQIHSGMVFCVDDKTDLSRVIEGDAVVTNQKGIVIGVRTADCLPLLVYDPVKNVIAAIHAGWRGFLAGVIENTFQILKQKYGCEFSDLEIALGPCISVKNFEVGDEVRAEFHAKFGEKFVSVGSHLDLVATAKNICENLGCDPKKIFSLDLCTFEHKDLFYSYRREPGPGRQFNFIGLL